MINENILLLINQKLKIHPVYGTETDGSCLCQKGIDCKSTGKHPLLSEWQLKATNEQSIINRWLQEKPNSNWGIATGELLTVIDADISEQANGVKTVNELIASGILPKTNYITVTPSGGQHFYYRTPKGTQIGNMVKVLDGVDIRGQNGYVLAAGSRIGYKTYHEIEGRELNFESLPYLPQSFIDLMSANRTKDIGIKLNGVIPSGKRNDSLFRVALRHLKQGNDDQSTLVYILDYNTRLCVPPLDDNEVVSITESAVRFYNKIKSDNGEVSESGKYTIHNGCISRITKKNDGSDDFIDYCNFSARIVKETVRDDGGNVTRKLTITGISKDGIAFPDLEISVSDFNAMFWSHQWGAKAIIYSGNNYRENIRVAIQELSGDYEVVHEYTHTGWREINGSMYFLSASGAIGSDGLNPYIKVNLKSENLQDFSLPLPPVGVEVIESIKGSLAAISEDFPEDISIPLYASLFRAAIGGVVEIDFSLMVVGSTGVLKTTYTGIINGHFGNFDEHRIPEGWCSTANALERKAFLVKDCWFVVDDFTPGETDPRTITYLVRGAGNGLGRTRLSRDGVIKIPNIPRCLLVTTGEDVPDGQSLRPRMLIIYVKKGDISFDAIDRLKLQSHHFPKAMSAFLMWFASNYEKKKSGLKNRFEQIRKRFVDTNMHGRVASNLANLCLGLEEFTDFAVEKGAMTADEAYSLIEDRAIPAFRKIAEQQMAHHRVSDPVDIFISNIRAALVTGKAHLKGKGNSYPSNPAQWGWKTDRDGNWVTAGEHIGWITEDEIWLQPEMAYNMANRLANHNQRIHVHRDALWTRMADRGLIQISHGESKNTVKRQVDQKRRPRVLVFRDFTLFQDNFDELNSETAPAPRDNNTAISPFGVTAQELSTKVYRSVKPIQAH